MSDNKRHVHAENMMQYGDDAFKTNEPWKLWEFKSKHTGDAWVDCYSHPEWAETMIYRRKPEIINVSFPKPVCYKLEKCKKYWTISLNGNISPACWEGSESDYQRLENGLIHLTKEAAKQHAEALIKITRGRS
ncbi:hypothetical protein [Photorhabdus bodei]|uniref:hypothetical protein n=1 Tax=Photorhabdus bodei TaxID=2029681 RepID=UPI001E620283|nr:hypothetical protein [Photorhabdus bodei]MCC8465841.1 hypothetical protein [Photorhabdus bodei]